MQSKHLGWVRGRQAVDVVVILVDLVTLRDAVAFVEDEVWLEHKVSEPDPAESVEQPLVIVVRDPTTVLDLSEHVVDSHPGHALRRTVSINTGMSDLGPNRVSLAPNGTNPDFFRSNFR